MSYNIKRYNIVIGLFLDINNVLTKYVFMIIFNSPYPIGRIISIFQGTVWSWCEDGLEVIYMSRGELKGNNLNTVWKKIFAGLERWVGRLRWCPTLTHVRIHMHVHDNWLTYEYWKPTQESEINVSMEKPKDSPSINWYRPGLWNLT